MLRRPPGSTRIATAALLALFWTIAPVAGVAHGLESRHRYCPEHGTFEETGAAESEGAEPRSGAHLEDAGAQDDAHAECAFAQLLRSDAPLTAERTWFLVPGTVHDGALALRSIDVHPVEVLATAPKSSPPARA